MERELNTIPLIEQFKNEFGCEPTVLIKAPGRVNCIGEHTDYNGLPVMPVAIPFTITVAASPDDGTTVAIKNTDPSFAPSTFDITNNIPHSPTGDWSNYVKAAANELSSRLGNDLKGMNALFHGTIPESAGLSSSSALVIASALSVLAVNGIDMDPVDLGEAMAYGEHYVGTQGGGMDQAICLLGKKDNAVKIDFFPLRHTYVPFPENHVIVVAHSLVRAAKTENALLLYNRRPAECRLATAMLNALFKPNPPLKRLGDLLKHGFYVDANDPEVFVGENFTRESYSLNDIATVTGISTDALTESCLMTRSGVPMPEPPDGFLIRQRARHVLTEAARVEESVRTLENSDPTAFGKLMDASHRSCDEDYGISTPELNRLTSIMRENGALGSRLTGAGFGGCAIALVRKEKADILMAGVRESYYNSFIAETRPEILSSGSLNDSLLFSIKPADGAFLEYL